MTFCSPSLMSLITRPLRLDTFVRTAEELSRHLPDVYDRADFMEVVYALVNRPGADFRKLEDEIADLQDEVSYLREQNSELEQSIDRLEDELAAAREK